MGEIPTPQITARPEGHFATCPACEQEFEVGVVEKPDPEGMPFVLSREPPGPNGKPGKPIDVVQPTWVEYSLSVFEKHYRQEH